MPQTASSPAVADELEAFKQETAAAIATAADLAALDDIRVQALGKKGRITEMMKTLGALPAETRKERGAALNLLKDDIATRIETRQKELARAAISVALERERVDVTLPARPAPVTPVAEGRVHPTAQTFDEIIAIFASMGFAVAKGPDIETDFNNFEALNFPPDHPARDMQDTFFLPPLDGKPIVLRTHTSPVQIRTMMTQKPPIRIIAPGRTYRCDHDMTHAPMFHQIEGLVIDETTHMGHLKGCLIDFLRAFFGIKDLPLRFRPSFFPFTEPSAEVDIGCSRKNGELKLGNYGDWLEIGGCGMVHPNVLRNCGLDPARHQGFAFGMGVERMAMLKYGIPDLRTFFEGDIRWLKHYGFLPLDIPNPALQAK
jgi:phenylalanyl-tRNA synthetase alpha chain